MCPQTVTVWRKTKVKKHLSKEETPKKQKISTVNNLKLLFEAAAAENKSEKSASKTRKF